MKTYITTLILTIVWIVSYYVTRQPAFLELCNYFIGGLIGMSMAEAHTRSKMNEKFYYERFDIRAKAYKDIESSPEWKDAEEFFEKKENRMWPTYNLRCMLKRKIVSGM